jgi:hypothetical protein
MSATGGFVVRRAAAQRLVLAAGFLTMLLATTVLAGTQLYAAAVTSGGLARVLAAAPLADRAAELTAVVPPRQFLARDAGVREAVREVFSGVGADVYASAVSASYALPARSAPGGSALGGSADRPDLTVFAAYVDLPAHADLVSGEWPELAAEGPVPVALSVAAAEALELGIGDQLELIRRVDDEPAQVVISATYRPRDPESAYWFADPLDIGGVRTGTFTTYGPLVVQRETLLGGLSDRGLTARWRIRPHLDMVSAGELANARRGAAALDSSDDQRLTGTLQTGLPELLGRVGRALLVARTAIFVPVAQLVLLAGFALLLTARLLGEHRRGESALLRARGASAGQQVGHALREGALLALVATALAPPLAAAGLRALDALGPLADAGLPLSITITPLTWVVAGLAAGGCALALVAPALRQPATYVESQQARGRQSRRSMLQRAGGDIVLLAVAALALWQLTRYGSPLLTDATGRLAADPLLVAGPALALLAGAVIALRLIPVLSGRAVFLGARRPGLAPALGAWQVGRRPQRYAGPALLLVMALSIGALSVTYAATWQRSQTDQANFRAGADLRFEPPSAALRKAVPPLGQAAAYAGLPGVAAAMPVHRADIDVSSLPADLVALDATQAGQIVTVRRDLADQPWTRLLEPLAEGRRLPSGAVVPGEPDSLRVVVRADSRKDVVRRLDLALVLRDSTGLLYRTPLGSIRTDGRRRSRPLELAALSGAGTPPAYPLAVVRVEATYAFPVNLSGLRLVDDTVSLALEEVRTSDGGTLPPVTEVDARVKTGGAQLESPPSAKLQPTTGDGPFLGLRIRAGVVDRFDGGSDALVTADIGPPRGSNPLPALLDGAAARATGLGVGDDLAIRFEGQSYNLAIEGIVDALPTVAPGRGAVVVDLPSLAAKHLSTSGDVVQAEEWWLDADRDSTGTAPDTAAAAAALSRQPGLARAVVDRAALGRELRQDPLGLAVIGALVIAFLAAAAFATVGFAVNATVSVRERLGELALLRALGVAPRQLLGLLAIEQAFLVGLGCVVGIVLGVLVARLVVPLLSLTAEATRAVPPVVLDVPWLAVLGLAAALALVLAAVVAGLATVVRRLAVAPTLRLGEDR